MRPKTAKERAASEVRSLLLEGHYYVGLWKEEAITSVYFRHPNGNQVRIEIDDLNNTAKLIVNSKVKKNL